MNSFDEARLIKAIVELSILKKIAIYNAIPWYKRMFIPKPSLDYSTASAYAHAKLIINFHKNRCLPIPPDSYNDDEEEEQYDCGRIQECDQSSDPV